MVNRTRRPKGRNVALLAAVVMCASVALFIAAPSSWGSPTVDPGGAAIATSTGEALVAPQALVVSAPRLHVISVMVIAFALLATAGVAVTGCTRRWESLPARHARIRALHWMQWRGPPVDLLPH
jgi:hypothetical protein